MNNTEENLITKIANITNEIKNYISSNKNWIFYFVNPLVTGDANKPIYDIIHDYPTEWEDYIDFDVVNVSGSSIQINVNIDDGSELGISLKRYIFLANFEESINRNMKVYAGKINEIRIENIKEEIEHYKKMLSEKEKELHNLLNNLS